MTRDGFTLLVMGFTGADALRWKLRYIEAFNRMEAALRAGAASINLDDPRVLRKLLIAHTERVEALEGEVAEQARVIEAQAPKGGGVRPHRRLGQHPHDLACGQGARHSWAGSISTWCGIPRTSSPTIQIWTV